MLDINFPTVLSGSKASPLIVKQVSQVKKTCVSARINLAALLQVSKLSPAKGGLNGPKILFY